MTRKWQLFLQHAEKRDHLWLQLQGGGAAELHVNCHCCDNNYATPQGSFGDFGRRPAAHLILSSLNWPCVKVPAQSRHRGQQLTCLKTYRSVRKQTKQARTRRSRSRRQTLARMPSKQKRNRRQQLLKRSQRSPTHVFSVC